MNVHKSQQFWCEQKGTDQMYQGFHLPHTVAAMGMIRWMEEILHHLGWLKPYK